MALGWHLRTLGCFVRPVFKVLYRWFDQEPAQVVERIGTHLQCRRVARRWQRSRRKSLIMTSFAFMNDLFLSFHACVALCYSGYAGPVGGKKGRMVPMRVSPRSAETTFLASSVATRA